MTWKIEKHYFDLQTRDGQSFIGYRGLWGTPRLRLPYGAWLWKQPGQAAVFKQSLSAGELTGGVEPTGPGPEAPAGLTWINRRLGLAGTWTGQGDGPSLRLESEQGYIDWRVLGAACPARVCVGDRAMSGLGYWEKVELSLAPWRLPFPELRWGRFLADEGGFYLVWVAWLGGKPEERRLWSPEGELAGLAFESEAGGLENGLNCEGGRLEFSSLDVLRQGPLFKTLGGRLSAAARLLPGDLGRAYEAKWFSRAAWRTEGGQDIYGWAIHEKVSWR